MFRRFSINFGLFAIFVDFLIVVAGLELSGFLRTLLNDTAFIKTISPEVDLLPWPIAPVIAILWVSIFLATSLYDGTKNLRLYEELTALTWAIALASIASAGVLFLTYRETSRFLFLLFVLLSSLMIIGWRIAFRLISFVRGSAVQRKRKVIIIGREEESEILKEHIFENHSFGLTLAGFVTTEAEPLGNGVLGNSGKIREIVKKFEIDDVIISGSEKHDELITQVVGALIDVPVHIWVMPDYLSLALHKASMEEYGGIMMFDLRAPALSDYERLVKRGFDLLLSVFLFLPSLFLMSVVSFLILVFDSSPIILRQSRVGENGRLFTIYKFRTMYIDTPQKIDKNNHKFKNDPRVTLIGKFLRRTSLDELPQLFNVIKGEMSLVGPRPELPELVSSYEDWQRTRFVVPPGITGWWQVNGRSEKPMHLQTEDDLYYVNHYSLWLDIVILVRTIWVVLVGRGAY